MTPAALLDELSRWRQAQWLGSLGLAFARFIHALDSDAPASLLLAAALAVQLEGQGHSAWPLSAALAEPAAPPGWPPEGSAALRQAWADLVPPAQASVQGLGEAWRPSPVVDIDPTSDAGTSPLVLCRGLLYLRRYWRHESRVAAQVNARVLALGEPDVDHEAARALLDRLFGAAGPAADTDWQKMACAVALRARLTIITGGPGTGKTYTAARLLVLLQALHRGPQPLRVALAAPTGKAAARLRQSIQQALQQLRQQPGAAQAIGDWADALPPARTLHALLGTQPGTRRFRHDAANPLEVDLLFVDEASMVHLEMMAQLLDALPPRVRLVLLGDKDQLASVEAGAVMGDLCHGVDAGAAQGGYRPETADWIAALTGQAPSASALGNGPPLAQQTVLLRKSHRFEGPIGRLALAVNQGDAQAAIAQLRSQAAGPVALQQASDAAALLPLAVDGRAGAPGGYRDYLELVARGPAQGQPFDAWAREVIRCFDRFRVLSALREGPWGVAGLNAAIERALAAAGLLSRRGDWYEGRPLVVTRNDPALGVFNGDVGIVLRGAGGDAALRCCFLDGDAVRSVSVGRLAEVETAYAMTVHKSQGSEFDHVLLVLPDEDAPVLTRELLYTGITRGSKAFTLCARHPELLSRACARLTQRTGGLQAQLAAAAAARA